MVTNHCRPRLASVSSYPLPPKPTPIRSPIPVASAILYLQLTSRMKASYLANFFAQCVIARSLAVPDDLSPTTDVEECGDLGIMPIPDGADPSLYRKCLLHPLGNINPTKDDEGSNIAPSIPDLEGKVWPQEQDELMEAISRLEDSPNNVLAIRSCWYTSWYGCKDGYCWSRCGCCPELTGYWCWTAADRGRGPWLRCSRNDQCNPFLSETIACGGGCSC